MSDGSLLNDSEIDGAVCLAGRTIRATFVIVVAFSLGFVLGERQELVAERDRLGQRHEELSARLDALRSACSWCDGRGGFRAGEPCGRCYRVGTGWKERKAGCRNCEHLDESTPWGWICGSCGRSSVPR